MAITREEVMDWIGNASILEINELVKDLEDKFGVSAAAAAPVAVLVEAVPKPVKEGITKEEAAEIKKKFEDAGATVEIK
jgi:large subunit ribosomal protein L7/L12